VDVDPTKGKIDAGELTAELRYFKPGTYDIKMLICYGIVQEPGSVGATALVYTADGKAGLKQISNQHTRDERGYRKLIYARQTTVSVPVGADGKAVIAKIRPIISGQVGQAKVDAEIWVLDISGPK
jgi:hypothetical protein